jgi:hypothetical protein
VTTQRRWLAGALLLFAGAVLIDRFHNGGIQGAHLMIAGCLALVALGVAWGDG